MNTANSKHIKLKEAHFTAMNEKSTMLFYDKSDDLIKFELTTIFPTVLIHSITDIDAQIVTNEIRHYDDEFKIITTHAKQHLANNSPNH